MDAIQNAIIQGVVGIMVVLIGAAFTGLKSFIQAKAEELRARTTDKQWQTGLSIARTVVEAVEQVYKELEGHQKLAKAYEYLGHELSQAGINLTHGQKKVLIEAAVKGMNDLKEAVSHGN